MKHVNAKASLGALKRLSIMAGLAAATQLLIACSSGNTLNLPTLANTASPTSADAQTAANGEATGSDKQFIVAQVIGAPQKVSGDLTSALVKSAGERKLAFSTTAKEGVKPDYTLQGYLVATPEKSGTKVSYIWDVTDAAGKPAHRIKGEELISKTSSTVNADPWSSVDGKTIEAIATKTVARIDSWLPKPGNTAPPTDPMLLAKQNTKEPAKVAAKTDKTVPAKPAAKVATTAPKKAIKNVATASLPKPVAKTPAAAPVAPKPIKVAAKTVEPKPAPAPQQVVALVPTVEGAPGDGQTSLTSAIKQQLNSRGIALAKSGQQAAYMVRGEVKLTPAAQSDKEEIAIEWRVIDPSGRKLGTVSQRNSIPKGSLDGAWGQTANAAASAAAEGIVKLLPTATN